MNYLICHSRMTTNLTSNINISVIQEMRRELGHHIVLNTEVYSSLHTKKLKVSSSSLHSVKSDGGVLVYR